MARRWCAPPSTSTIRWITGPATLSTAPWADDVRDGSGRLLSLTHYFYDGQNTSANTVGAKGELTRVAKYYDVPLATNAQNVTLHGQDTTYTYDAYGNRLTETTYASPARGCSTAASWDISAPGAGSAARTHHHDDL